MTLTLPVILVVIQEEQSSFVILAVRSIPDSLIASTLLAFLDPTNDLAAGLKDDGYHQTQLDLVLRIQRRCHQTSLELLLPQSLGQVDCLHIVQSALSSHPRLQRDLRV